MLMLIFRVGGIKRIPIMQKFHVAYRLRKYLLNMPGIVVQ